MKYTILALCMASASAFAPSPAFRSTSTSSSSLAANIRGPTEKAEVLANGWDGTTALGGAVEVAKPSRMLDEIREAGETIPDACEVFNANLEMDASELMFEEVIEVSYV